MSDIIAPTTLVTTTLSVALVIYFAYFFWSQYQKSEAVKTHQEQLKVVRASKGGDEVLDFQFQDICFEDTQIVDPFLDLTGRWRIAETGEWIVATKPNLSGVFDFVIGSPYIPARSLRGPYIGFLHKDNPRQVHIYAANLEWKGEILDQDHITFVNPSNEVRTWIRWSESPFPVNP